MTTSHCVVLPLARVEPVIGRAFAIGPNAKQRAEGVEWVEPAIEAESELIQVGLQVFWLDATVMGALQPRLEV